jgi:hypothetical protein
MSEYTGPTGFAYTGDIGPTGLTGPTGPSSLELGPTGYTGPTGPTGTKALFQSGTLTGAVASGVGGFGPATTIAPKEKAVWVQSFIAETPAYSGIIGYRFTQGSTYWNFYLDTYSTDSNVYTITYYYLE